MSGTVEQEIIKPILYKTVYAHEELPTEVKKSIFFAGPTPRNAEGLSWRTTALEYLRSLGYDGHVFIPEPRDGKFAWDYTDQVEWEESALHMADCIVFYVPRDIDGTMHGGYPMPGFTTNDEWGRWKESGKVIFGAPSWAKKVRFQQYYAKKLGVPSCNDLWSTLKAALNKLGDGALREGGCCQVPLHIWNKTEFQRWLESQKEAGNRLDGCRVLWTFWVGENRNYLFSWALHVDVHIGSENRNKINEFIIQRSDIAVVVLYSLPTGHANILNTKVVLIKEFRSPARNSEGFVFEPPGGSSKTPESAISLAAKELEEETGFKIDPKRLKPAGSRQIGATLSTHHGIVFGAHITPEEIAEFEKLAKEAKPRGIDGDSERTYVKVATVHDLLNKDLVDWATLGMILASYHKAA